MSTTPTTPATVPESRYDYQRTTIINQGALWGRKAEILIARKATSSSQETTEAILLSGTPDAKGTTASGDSAGFHFNFHVASSDFETPNLLTCKIYNLAPSTINRVVREFDQISVSAGYEHSNYGLIFTGTIKQFRRGKESTTDTFLEIIAGDNDIGYNFGFVNTTIPLAERNQTWVNIYNECVKALQVQPDQESLKFLQNTGVFFPRGRTIFNLARVMLRELADSVGARWSVQNGILKVIPNQGVMAGTYINLTPETGLVGIPSATDQGVEARILLNPNIAIGTQVSIDKSLIVETTTLEHYRPNLGYVAYLSNTNQYRVLSIDHYGDTRGQDWYTDIVCIAVQATADKLNEATLLSAGGTS